MRRLRLRALSEAERTAVEKLAHSRTAPARQVERARIVWQASQDQIAPAIAAALHLTAYTVRAWVKRFNAQGLAGLEDQPRAGRPPTYTPEQVATVIATALTDPKRLDLPFGSWTLDRLAAYLSEHKGSRSSAAGSTRSCSRKACAGGGTRRGSGSGSILRSRKKGADREPLHCPASRQRSRLPG